MDPLIPCGAPAPDFELLSLEGQPYRLSQARGRLVVLNFWSAECPWAERVDRELSACLADWGPAVALWTIACNANEPAELIAQAARQRGLPLVLLDPRQTVADLYGAQTTPHLFVVDAAGLLRYQGAYDDVSFRQRLPTRHYLRQAVKALLAGRSPDPAQTPPYGCALVRYTQLD